jgi:NAD(P)-dependent dehydrogenase (short-subunit alcohol dehydrogenase family)
MASTPSWRRLSRQIAGRPPSCAVAARRRQAASSVPLGRLGELREVGLLAVYLSSPASSYVTGQTIAIDGGRTLV